MKHIYVMQAEDGRVKVGVSGKPEQRRRQIETAGGLRVALVKAFAHSNARALEREVHTVLAGKKIVGEWFDVSSDEAVAAILNAWNIDPPNSAVGVRLTDENRDWLEARSLREDRSLNWLINKILEQAREAERNVRK